MTASFYTHLVAASVALFAVLAAAGGPAHAKEYNKSPYLASEAQAKVNRFEVELFGLGSDSEAGEADGQSTAFGQPCETAFGADAPIRSEGGKLTVGGEGAKSFGPDRDQIIVVDEIINVGGDCRLRR